MIDFVTLRNKVVKGLGEYLSASVIRANQNEKPPAYPYLSYTVTTLASENNGTYGVYTDGIDRKPVKQTWSITAQSDSNDESVTLAAMAREWLDHVGTIYLQDNGIIVQSVTSITNRDNILTIEYEYKNGFDVVFWLFDEVENPIDEIGEIDTVELHDESNT